VNVRKDGKSTTGAGQQGTPPYHPERAFETTTLRILQSLAIDDAISDWIITELGAWYDSTTTHERDKTERLQRRITDLERLSAASYEEKLLGKITEETWRAHEHRWRQELTELRIAQNSATPTVQRDEFLRRVRTPLELVQQPRFSTLRRT